MRGVIIGAGCLLSVWAAFAGTAERGVVVRDVELKQEPYSDAASVAPLAANSSVLILARQGAWLQVEAGAQRGWLRLLAVRTAASAKSGDSGLQQALNVARSGASGTAVATGVRGLSKEQIQNAEPNTVELERLQRYSASEDQARTFAQEPPALATTRLEYLDDAGGGQR